MTLAFIDKALLKQVCIYTLFGWEKKIKIEKMRKKNKNKKKWCFLSMSLNEEKIEWKENYCYIEKKKLKI